MRDFQVLFDRGEHSEVLAPNVSPYGKLGFPAAPANRPWVYTNFVQTVDGVVSLMGSDASGGDISQSPEDRWLMDLLRAHADGVLLGLGTLVAETKMGRPRERGPIFRIVEPTLQQLRSRLGRGREKNIFVTGAERLRFQDYAVFDGEKVDPYVVTTESGARLLEPQLATHPHVRIIVAGQGQLADLALAMRILREEHGIKYLLCEGGPTLYAGLIRAHLIDEKFLTVAPFDAGLRVPNEQTTQPGSSDLRLTIFPTEGFAKDAMVRWRWMSCRKIEDHQFHRFRRM